MDWEIYSCCWIDNNTDCLCYDLVWLVPQGHLVTELFPDKGEGKKYSVGEKLSPRSGFTDGVDLKRNKKIRSDSRCAQR